MPFLHSFSIAIFLSYILRLVSIWNGAKIYLKNNQGKHGQSLNPLVTNGLYHPYHLDEPTLVFRGIRSSFSFLLNFSDANHKSKQNSLRWDAAFCGVTSGAILVACVP